MQAIVSSWLSKTSDLDQINIQLNTENSKSSTDQRTLHPPLFQKCFLSLWTMNYSRHRTRRLYFAAIQNIKTFG